MSLRCSRCRLAALRRPAPHPHSLAPRPRTASSPVPSAVHEMLSRPTWSVRSLRYGSPSAAASTEPVATTTPAQLHHLLRLAALPLPASKYDEDAMLATLDSQLRFVRAVQSVDTRGVEPLSAIRDETAQGVGERALGLADLRHVLDKEALVGHYRRPRRVRDAPLPAQPDAGEWDALSTASRKAGKYFVVESGPKDGGAS
ncbi:glu-tRNAGln amidotransferase C subunit [Hirsutella rhossiliensis]|uniref:Glu-tRNAGln amidotransferase C subunit domain-containing protein n=1 Tax=Hirsutella rhossiliensis TaxID=111463 RepID=A0A9P8SLJ8_9HYPO|nr:glu-tRNAGln amidotransferase C subunit domain-containing protein [Hirsutella rhossiliensis]KAH0967036.1 glu-tRNAGln amidotransferase C subunit domain-containing protein [Hirsutella rhossiliensis]